MKAPKLAAETAASMSASARTTIGALPPSSSPTRWRWRPALSAIRRPILVEPVKLMRRVLGLAMSSSTTSATSGGALVMTLTTPLGKPASSKTEAIIRCVAGHSSDGGISLCGGFAKRPGAPYAVEHAPAEGLAGLFGGNLCHFLHAALQHV